MAAPEGQPGRWGRSQEHHDLSPAARAFLLARLGPGVPSESAVAATSVSRLGAQDLAALRGIVGDDGVQVGDMLRYSTGMSYLDLVAVRAGTARLADAAVLPRSHDEVLAVLRWCSEKGVAVVPFGGGTSVVGGVNAPDRTCITLATHRMSRLLSVDESSALAVVEPGATGPELEPALAARGWTFGHFPQSWERATIGGYAATRSAGQASTGYGRIEDLVQAAVLATPTGTWRVGHPPASAAGPDLLHVALGSEGALGVFTELTLRIRRAPARAHAEGAVAPDFESGVAALRDLAQAGLCPTVLRLSDADETTATLAMSGPRGAARSALDAYLRFRGIRQPALAVLVWESADASVLRARRRAAWRLLSKHGFASLGASTGRAWERSRFGGPYLRDTLMDEGYLVETFETAAPWSRVSELSDALRRTVQSAIPGSYAMTHISHVYETGASIYVTVLASATADGLPIVPGEQGERWARAKRAIMDTIVAGGGTITHHHGVGRDHAPWLGREVSDEGLRVLRAVKDAVDPAGVMNPGVLVRPNGG